MQMGKAATLAAGFWPGCYERFGYDTIKEKRGRRIVLNPEEAEAVQAVFTMFVGGKGVTEIRRWLVAHEVKQKTHGRREHDWDLACVYSILRARDYTGEAIWTQKGQSVKVQIPKIIDLELWQLAQDHMAANTLNSTRRALGVYLIQNIGVCGNCGKRLFTRTRRWYTSKRGERKPYINPPFEYFCIEGNRYPEHHPRPFAHSGKATDEAVWHTLVENLIKHPDIMQESILARQRELKGQAGAANGEIANAEKVLARIDKERAFYQRQAATEVITEAEFLDRMAETKAEHEYWQAELIKLQALLQDQDKVRRGVDYVALLLGRLQGKLDRLNKSAAELAKLPGEERDTILKERQEVVRVLCDHVKVYANGDIVIEGALDGSEAIQLGFVNSRTDNCSW
jgi:hypothetical protein